MATAPRGPAAPGSSAASTRQSNGRLAVCARHAGRLHFRSCGGDLKAARSTRAELVAGLAAGRVPASPRLRLDTVAARWSARFEAMVAAGERHRRTCEAHRFQLDHDILPRLGRRRVSSLTVDVAAVLIGELRAAGRSPKTTANALATLQSILRLARRRGWIVTDPVERPGPEERPRPPRRPRGRVLGREEVARLLECCPPAGRLQVETALFSGLRISELLGLAWADVDFDAGLIRVRAQLSRAHRDEPARRVRPPIEMRLTGDRRDGRLHGVQLVGHRGSEVAKRIEIPATAIFNEMGADEVSDLDLSYTPPLGSPWEAIQMGAQELARALGARERAPG